MLRRLLELLYDSLIYGMSGLLTQVVALLLLPVYTNGYLSTAEFGVLQLLGSIMMVFTTLATAGMKFAVYQRFHRETDESDRRTMMGTALASICASGLFWCALGIFLASHINTWILKPEGGADYTKLVIVNFLTGLIATIGDVPLMVLQLRRQPQTVAKLNILQLVVTTSTTLLLVVVYKQGALGFLIGMLVGTTADTVVSYVVTWHNFAPRFSTTTWRQMTRVGLPFLPHRLQAAAMLFLADYLINSVYGLNKVGIYSIAMKFCTPIGLVTSALQQGWQPYKYKLYAEDKNPKPFFSSVFTYYLAGLAFLYVGICAWGPEMVRLMTQPAFHGAIWLIWAIALAKCCAGIYPMMATGIELSENTKLVPVTTFGGLITMIAGCLLLIPLQGPFGGPVGAALATAASWLTISVLFFIISLRVYPIKYDWKAVAEIVVLTGAFVATSYWLQYETTWIRLPLVLLLTIAYPLVLALIFFRSAAERHRIKILWERLSSLRRESPSPAVEVEAQVAAETELAQELEQ